MIALRPSLFAAAALAVFAATAAEASATKIAFVGDSMADGIWGAFYRVTGREKCEADQLALIRDARNGTGLARLDSYDWLSDVDKLVAAQKPDLIVASFGLNDRQAVVGSDRTQVKFGASGWAGAYKNNVVEFYRHASAGGARVLMIGLPTLRNDKANAHAQFVNSIYADVAGSDPALKATFVTPWKPDGGDGSFASYGSGVGGGMVQLRAPDGIHFTQAGYDVLAAYLKAPVTAALTAAGIEPGGQCLGL